MGYGQKSSMLGWLLDIFIEYQNSLQKQSLSREEYNFYKKVYLSTQKELIAQAAQALKRGNIEELSELFHEDQEYMLSCHISKEAYNTPPTLFSTTPTNFGIVKSMFKNGGAMYFCSAEPSGYEEIIKKDALELVLKGFSQDLYSRISGIGHFYLPHPALNILIASQPPFLEKLIFSKKLMEQGFLARFLIAINTLSRIKNFDIDIENGVRLYRNKIFELLNNFYTRDLYAQRFKVQIRPEALSLLNTFKDDIHMQYSASPLKNWAAKLHGQVARIALAIHAWNFGKNLLEFPINEEEINSSIEIARLLLEQALFLYAPEGYFAMKKAQQIKDSFLRITTPQEQANLINNGISSTQIQQRTSLRKSEVFSGLDYLAKRFWVTTWDDGSGVLKVIPHRNFFCTFETIL